ncbi:MAG: bifunctional isocitrate dehydrogenase kinase/phosphatase [Deltaproteobacteria bacterium]|nr:bifunctional isocitrate dehydrogenase kinase/phosphatase [Deltaproteobacteria bacterium]
MPSNFRHLGDYEMAFSGAKLSREAAPLAVASSVYAAFERYQEDFIQITLRARERFETRDYRGADQDATERLELYDIRAKRVAAELAGLLGENYTNNSLWVDAKESYCELIEIRYDVELAMTFYNSVTRRVHGTVGLDAGIEFYDSDFEINTAMPELPSHLRYPWQDSCENLVSAVLSFCSFQTPFADLDSISADVSKAVNQRLKEVGLLGYIRSLDFLTAVFYRDGGAYIIGRLSAEDECLPIVFCLRNRDDAIVLDAVLLDEDSVSILFSFAHSYFFVNAKHHRKMIEFLSTIMPLKRIDELYASIGHYKHAKTELHRNLRWHMARSSDRFEFTKGKKGMVMVVFTLPSYGVVFKVIRDSFLPPKKTDRQRVLDCYELVFKHDKVGRLVDAQEFVALEFRKDRFDPEVLEELCQTAASTVSVKGESVFIKHLYTERRVVPLDVYVTTADEESSRLAILDYGMALKELAAANLFPGDLFLKNFGVTRHGRVVFYDYDELCVLSDCNFRVMPKPRYDFEEMEAETWFAVAENDIFPEEFRSFVGIPGTCMGEFEETHGDIFTPGFWRDMQEVHARGEFIEIFPYQKDRQRKY